MFIANTVGTMLGMIGVYSPCVKFVASKNEDMELHTAHLTSATLLHLIEVWSHS